MWITEAIIRQQSDRESTVIVKTFTYAKSINKKNQDVSMCVLFPRFSKKCHYWMQNSKNYVKLNIVAQFYQCGCSLLD